MLDGMDSPFSFPKKKTVIAIAELYIYVYKY